MCKFCNESSLARSSSRDGSKVCKDDSKCFHCKDGSKVTGDDLKAI